MITQAEADTLLALPKEFTDLSPLMLPPGADEHREVLSRDRREAFTFDAWRGTFRISKVKLQTRARRIVVLARLDLDGAPHTNPDGEKIDTPHIHIYKEGYEDKWAYPLDPEIFSQPLDLGQAYVDFCRFVHIQSIAPLQAGAW